eukprot:3906843-Rhodomonas_salina.1
MPFRVPAYLGSWYKFKPAAQVRKRRRAHGQCKWHSFAQYVCARSCKLTGSEVAVVQRETRIATRVGVYFGREENLHAPNAQNAQCKS